METKPKNIKTRKISKQRVNGFDKIDDNKIEDISKDENGKANEISKLNNDILGISDLEDNSFKSEK